MEWARQHGIRTGGQAPFPVGGIAAGRQRQNWQMSCLRGCPQLLNNTQPFGLWKTCINQHNIRLLAACRCHGFWSGPYQVYIIAAGRQPRIEHLRIFRVIYHQQNLAGLRLHPSAVNTA